MFSSLDGMDLIQEHRTAQILSPGRLDAFIREIDFGLAAMVAYVNVHSEQKILLSSIIVDYWFYNNSIINEFMC